MNYTKKFDPETPAVSVPAPATPASGDRRDGAIYVYRPEIVLAVNVALATGRPLLLRGPPGSGKSSLARHVSRVLGWRYYEEVVTSRTQARDLLWKFDTLRRLNDSQIPHRDLQADVNYVEPGVLWWAFNRKLATRRGAPEGAQVSEATDPREGPEVDGAVVLLDEIDKADPDVPNNLLVPIGSLQFQFTDTGGRSITVKGGKSPPLIFITTNDERELPNAFLRRCVILKLRAPGQKRLISIALAHFKDEPQEGDDLLFSELAKKITPARDEEDEDAAEQRRPSTAEYLDAVRTCRRLGVKPVDNDDAWQAIRAITLQKERTGMSSKM
jgi:MoxR-like ATPase